MNMFVKGEVVLLYLLVLHPILLFGGLKINLFVWHNCQFLNFGHQNWKCAMFAGIKLIFLDFFNLN